MSKEDIPITLVSQRTNLPAAYLKVMDCNVIIVDWSAIADDVIYTVAAKSVPSVAEHVASFVNFMRAKAGLETSTMKFIGHSLGAHVASLSARIVNKSSPVPEVVGEQYTYFEMGAANGGRSPLFFSFIRLEAIR